MTCKIVNITIPVTREIPEEIQGFSPEENYIMLKIGSQCLLEGRRVVAGLTQKEIYEKIKEESKEEIQKMELNLLVERETSKKIEERMNKMYETQMEQLKKQLETVKQQLSIYESENTEFVHVEVNKAREKYDLLLQEKDYQNKLSREAVEKLQDTFTKLVSKSTSQKGSDGEKQFYDYANTFKDFKDFEIVDKHTQGGEGDFHLHFEEFNVLVDAKNYKKKVPIDQREKIKKDLLKNEHIHFAWLVSLNTTIDKFDKAPIMYEWINTRQCIVYINNLNSFEDPQKILRIVWFTCKELYKFVEDDVKYDTNELTELKEKNFKLMDKVKNIRKNIREINTSMNATRNLIQLMDDNLREILETETNDMVYSNFSLFDEWWNLNIEITNDETIVLSTDLWLRFKQENKVMIKEFEITTEKFKKYIKSKVPFSCLNLKSKNANSAIEIKGLKMKEMAVQEEKMVDATETEKMEIEFVENVELKKKKQIKQKKKEFFFDEIFDNKILLEYQNIEKDIMDVAEDNKIRPWQVVSVLMKNNILVKRDQARGYDKYKETEEYKSKINS
jgi:hypothetical protein